MNETKLARPEVRLGASEERPEEYRPVSSLAVVSLVIGAFSVLAMAFSIFAFVPVLGVGCALVALRQIRAPSSRKAGTGVALAGLVLSLLFGSWAVTQGFVREWTLKNYAEPYATGWLQRICDGNLAEAHQIYMEPSRRRPPGTDLARYYAENETARREMEAMFAEGILRILAEHGSHGKLTFLGVDQCWRDQGVDFVALEYVFEYQDQGGEPRQHKLRVVMRRFFDPNEGIAVWGLRDVAGERVQPAGE